MNERAAERWCKQNKWREPFLQEGKYYAFAPNAVIPQPIPVWWNIFAGSSFTTQGEPFILANLASLIFVGFYFSLIIISSFLLPWWGIWSIYISQVGNQKFLACRYCPMTPGVLIEMKDSNQGLQEVEAELIPKTRLLVTDYSGSAEVEKLISREEVQGRVLFLFN